ncbi:MAG: NAD-dependent epimerase/dehydratase family protein [Candidatus Odinarchaeota archaeon]
MRILVTGGLGHIGSQLIRDLTPLDPEIIRIFDNFSAERYCSLFNLPTNVGYELIEGDIRNKNAINAAMEDIDLVYHLAALTNAPESFTKKDLTKEVNLIGTKNVIDACCRSGVEKLLYPSTTSVYGPTDGVAREDCPEDDYKPQSPYAEYKLLGEREVTQAHRDYGLDSVVLRLGTIFGSSIGMRFHTAINKFIFLACTNRPITVWDGALNQKRPYLDLIDALSALKFLSKPNLGSGEVFNVVTENLSVQQIIDLLRELFPDLKIEVTKNPLLNQLSYFTDDSKIRKIGFSPKGDIRKSMKETVDLFTGLTKKDG